MILLKLLFLCQREESLNKFFSFLLICFIIGTVGDFMEKYDVKFKKKFGQNFLKNINIVKRIVDVSGVNSNDLVIEVGPGGAIMTRELASCAKNVLAYEISKPNRLFNVYNGSGVFRFILTETNIEDGDNLKERIANYADWKPAVKTDGDHKDSEDTIAHIVDAGKQEADRANDDNKGVWL